MSVVYGHNKDGSAIYHCSAKRKDGEGCGHRVSGYGRVCGQHRGIARREALEAAAQARKAKAGE